MILLSYPTLISSLFQVIIYFKNVVAIKREKTAFVVPNAISIRTLKKRVSYLSS